MIHVSELISFGDSQIQVACSNGLQYMGTDADDFSDCLSLDLLAVNWTGTRQQEANI